MPITYSGEQAKFDGKSRKFSQNIYSQLFDTRTNYVSVEDVPAVTISAWYYASGLSGGNGFSCRIIWCDSGGNELVTADGGQQPYVWALVSPSTPDSTSFTRIYKTLTNDDIVTIIPNNASSFRLEFGLDNTKGTVYLDGIKAEYSSTPTTWSPYVSGQATENQIYVGGEVEIVSEEYDNANIVYTNVDELGLNFTCQHDAVLVSTKITSLVGNKAADIEILSNDLSKTIYQKNITTSSGTYTEYLNFRLSAGTYWIRLNNIESGASFGYLPSTDLIGSFPYGSGTITINSSSNGDYLYFFDLAFTSPGAVGNIIGLLEGQTPSQITTAIEELQENFGDLPNTINNQQLLISGIQDQTQNLNSDGIWSGGDVDLISGYDYRINGSVIDYSYVGAAALSHTHGLTDLTAFNVSSPSTTEVLVYDGSDWINTGNLAVKANGLIAAGHMGGNLRTISTSTTLANDDSVVVLIGGNNIIITMPTVSLANNNAVMYVVNKTPITVTIQSNATDRLDGSYSSLSLAAYSTATLKSNGISSWWVLEKSTLNYS